MIDEGIANGKYIEKVTQDIQISNVSKTFFTETSKIKRVMTICFQFQTNQLVSLLLLKHISLIQ